MAARGAWVLRARHSLSPGPSWKGLGMSLGCI